MSSSKLDDLDHRIIEALGRDGRSSNRQIAGELGVTEGTIRSRIKRLQKDGLIQFTVVTSFRMAGSPNLVMMGIHADPSRVSELAAELSAIPAIGCVMILLGRYSLMAMGLFTSLEQVHDLVSSRIKILPGIREVDVSVSVHSIKYDAGMARIIPRKDETVDTED